MSNDWLLLFSGSPVISVLNLLAKLAPISEPRRLMTDQKPVFSPSASVLFAESNLRFDPPVIDIYKDDEEGGEMPARFASDDYEDQEDEEEVTDMGLEKKANYNRYFLKQ